MRRVLKHILITAGPTREYLDPVRYLSNNSTGEMGYQLAREAKRRGMKVTLISGPVTLPVPEGVQFVAVVSAADLLTACRRHFSRCDALVMNAAVCDFRPPRRGKHKLKRSGKLTITLEKTPDILAGLARKKGKRQVIGFCLETEDWLMRAHEKCRSKGLDGIIANRLTPAHSPFGKRRVQMALVDQKGNQRVLKQAAKAQIARHILNWMETLGQQKAVQK